MHRDSQDGLDYFPLPSMESIEAFQEEQLVNGFTFPLTATSLGRPEPMLARVRRLSTIDKAAINALPSEMRDVIFEGLTEFNKQQKIMADADDPTSMNEMMANNDKVLAAANAWCEAAFIHPQIVRTREQAVGKQNTWYLDLIHPEDRVGLLFACLDADNGNAAKLKMFRPKRRDAVENGGNVSMAETAERPVESQPSGVFALPTA